VTVEEKTQWLEFWDSFLSSWKRVRFVRRDAIRELKRYIGYTLKLSRRNDPFYASMRDSIKDFHRELRSSGTITQDAVRAAEVLDWCDSIRTQVASPTSPRDSEITLSAIAPRNGEVVILGASGFIGRRVVAKLNAAGHPVTAVVRRSTALPLELRGGLAGEAVRVLRARLEDPDSLQQVVQGARAVIHLATGGGATWPEVEATMVNGSLTVANACLEHGVNRFVYVSSIAALYLGPERADEEIEDDDPVDAKPEARALYSRGKIVTENVLRDLHRERGLPLVIVRPGVVLGLGTPMQHSGLGFWARDNHCVGWGRGDHPLPVVWVDDVADALVAVVEGAKDDVEGKALHLCSRTPLSASEVVAELRASTGRFIQFHPRSLWLSQLLEIGKWLVKLAGRRPDAQFPSFRDLKSRALVPPFSARIARERLKWRPVENREEFLTKAVRVYGQQQQ